MQVYERYKVLYTNYTMDCFGNADDEESTEEFIIENGIMAYILMA